MSKFTQLEVADLHKVKGGKLAATVQLWAGEELAYGRKMLDIDDIQLIEKLAEELHEKGLEDSETQLRSAIYNAKESISSNDTYGMPPAHRYSSAAQFMLDTMTENGKWLYTDAGSAYYFNGITAQPVNVGSEEMEKLVVLKFRRVKGDPGMDHLFQRIRYEAYLRGEKVNPRSNSWYDRVKNTLYLDLCEGQMLKVTADADPEVLRNTDDGVMFEPDSLGEKWEYKPDHKNLLREWISRMNFSRREECPLTPEEQQTLFELWIKSFWFRSQIHDRPIAIANGPADSGKTTAMAQMGRLLLGPRFSTNLPPDKEKPQDFAVSLVNQRVLIVDNLDKFIPWFQDVVASVATGSPIKTRVLFRNMEQGEYWPDSYIGITTREHRHRRDDIASRSIFFLFQSLTETEREDKGEMQDWLLAHRDDILSEMVDFAREVLKTDTFRPRLALRLTGFELFMHRAALTMDRLVREGRRERPMDYGTWGELVINMIDKQIDVQRDEASQAEPLMQVLPFWVEESKFNKKTQTWEPNTERWVTTTELLRELTVIADREKLSFSIETATALGMRLGSRRPLLETQFVVSGPDGRGSYKNGKERRSGSFYNIRPAESVEGEALE